MDVERLRLIDESTPISSHIYNRLLTQLPNGFVHSLQLLRDIWNVLNRSVIRNNTILHIITPKAQINKITQQPRIHDLEFPSKNASRVDIRGVWLETFIETEDLRSTRRWHGSNEERIAKSMRRDFFLEFIPIPKIGRRDAPKVILESALTSRTALESLVSSVTGGEFGRCFNGSMVDSLEDLDVEILRLGRVKRHSQC